MSKGKDDAPHELESQFVLRLPPVRARSVRALTATPGPARLAGRHRLPQAVTRPWGSCGSGCGSRLGALGPGYPLPILLNGFSTAFPRRAPAEAHR